MTACHHRGSKANISCPAKYPGLDIAGVGVHSTNTCDVKNQQQPTENGGSFRTVTAEKSS
jgi:hypothetical protein